VLSDRATRVLNRGTTSGVLGLAVAGFAMSYDALHSLALTQGVPTTLAWMWPLVVDGFIVVASLSVVRAVANSHSAHYPWLLVLTFSTISVTFNVVHATPTVVARFVAAIPPTALVLSFELLMRHLREALRPAITGTPEAATPTSIVLDTPTTSPPAQQPGLSGCASSSPLLERARNIYAAACRTDERVTGVLLARKLGISDGYARGCYAKSRRRRRRPAMAAQAIGW
jgi:hypothetical protein